MFGPFWPNELREQAARAGEATIVSRERFVELMMEAGKTREQAEMHATIAETMGSAVLIGEKMWKIGVEQ